MWKRSMREGIEAQLARKPERCPRCGSGELRYLIWGLPVDPRSYLGDDWETKVAIGGCLMSLDGPPEWQCAGCWLQFSLSAVQRG